MANENKEKQTSEGKGGSDMEIVVSGPANETKGNALARKYKEMANMRRDYEDIDIRDCIPTLEEMVKDDLMYEILEDAANGKTEDDVISTAFYTEEPPKFDVGYDEARNVFIFKANRVNFTDAEIDLNQIDGDTMRIPLNSVIGAEKPFTMNNGESYESFFDYCYKKGIVDKNADDDKKKLQIRLVGINCPEIPHFDVQMMKESDIVSMSLSEARNKKNCTMLKYKYSGTAALDRNDDKIDFYRVKNASGEYTYHEIIKDKDGSKYIDSEDKKSGYVYKVIVTSDDSTKDTLVGGYKAKENLMNLMSNGNIYFMLDANGIKANKTSSKYKLYYNHWWNVGESIKDMIDQWCDYTNETTLTKLSYSPYGTDGYGRFVGAVYAPCEGLYANVAKYNIADEETKSVANPDFTNSPELNNLGGDNAAAFELYSYEKNNQIWLDSFSEMTKESYNARIAFHKEVTGIDFLKFRNCTMMIGDTLLLIPPQNIRSLSSIEYEKVGIMRGKGSMVKNNTNRDMFIEVDLFFYNGSGINGIAKEVTMPNGEAVTYYMNGLRSLIAQFKVAPYLPIENQFINDVLGIEAVSLVNLSINTVEGMPRLLQATLTMRDFNYRIYMPDIPIDYSYNQVSEIAQMNPIFAKCFNWEVFRFYYQRLLSYGDYQKEFDYNSPSYNKEVYSKREALQPVYFCEKDGFGASAMSFFIPDENWLKAALSIKKDKEFYGQNLITTETTETAKNWITTFTESAKCINEINNSKFKSNKEKFFKDTSIAVQSQATTTNTYVKNAYTTENSNLRSQKVANVVTAYVKPMLKPIVEQALNSEAISGVTVNEITDIKNLNLDYEVMISLSTQELSTIDMEAIKESVRDYLGLSSIIGIFRDGQLVFNVRFKLKKDGVNYKIDTGTEPKLVGRSLQNKDEENKVSDLEILKAFANSSVGIDKGGTETTNATLDSEYNYLDPAKLKFVPYIENIELQDLRFTLSNNFSDVTLKIMDGFAPQYMGSSDITIEASFITTNEEEVSMINVLPAHAANIGKLYRRILSCWPIKVRNHYLQMAGINEVLIDLVEIQTLQGYPGTYEVRMRMTSVDRTTRQRETLKQLESDEESSTRATASMNSYWDLDNVLASAELYPDLALPSIKELATYGFNFIRYRNSKQAYPDPDFYMTYSWPYTSYIIKKNLKDVFYNNIFHDEGKEKSELLDDTSYEFFDQMGMTLYQKLDPVMGMTEAQDNDGNVQNKLCDLFDETMAIIDEGATENIPKSDREQARELEERDCANLSDLLIYLTACDVQQGWTIKPGFTAPVVVPELNLDVEKLYCSGIPHDEATVDEIHNAYAQDVFDLRAETIKAIDDYLSDPIDYGAYDVDLHATWASQAADGYGGVISKVVNQFASEKKGKKILQLLNPFEDMFSIVEEGFFEGLFSGDVNKYNGEPDYNDDENDDTAYMANYLAGFLYSAAKCISAENTFDEDSNEDIWEPRQYAMDGFGKVKKDKDGERIPNCLVENAGRALQQADSLDEALKHGIQWGMFQIKIYRASELQKMLQPKSRVCYLKEDELAMYKDPETGKARWHPGFIDPYYNIAGYRSQVGKEYIKKIATNEGINTIAFLRVMLMHLRRMIIDGQIFSEIDVISKDFDEIKETIEITPDGEDHTEAAQEVSTDGTFYRDGGDIIQLIKDVGSDGFEAIGKFFGNFELQQQTQIDAIEDAVGDEDAAGTILELIENMPKTYRRSFCSRLILPMVMAVTEGSDTYRQLIVNYDLSELNSLTVGATITSSEPLSLVAKYCKAMSSIGMLDFAATKTDPETTSDSQKLWNYIMREAYTKLADDPQAYVLHSYYDMLINDKRGRLIRAFPTYYIVFMDEGRKIGSWKLFDNFYNMSAISEIVVSKSRKIPADTCSFVMSNMYTSYAAAYDNTTRQQYVDVYGLRDVFNSIFCPEAYFIKEDSIRRRKENLETVVLQPGVRIHVRMGYGADASRLPVAFNGKIAEVDVDEVVQVVAQGDGIELCNPLNTLGEIDAVELTEAQSWTTMLKDIRGSMKRGGESPRNLLSKLLTAKYGGVFKTVVRGLLNERFYGDNPFGIYHFGDNRFNSIFKEGETVQNLYEVCDATLLKGSNELYTSRENTMATPTINTSIQDKTFWDILQLCAHSGVGYMGAVRDFGMRSTICLCKPNHYYAYAYKRIDDEDGETEGKIVERRKPFQQFHYYDSYTDIVYNSIKASEKNMKTNAVGIWESTDMIWGKSQSTVGPIYLDMNIYPEHQKSMTVDTTLISDGAGGLELNIFTHFSANWASDANDNKVNKALAERITTNVLRESVSNMYCGEVCVLGDTSVKPYDRFYINDCYEDMCGHLEVEAVVYSMNSATGFTTTIYPDAIIRMAEDNHEAARQMVNGAMIGSLGLAVAGRLMGISTFARLDTQLMRVLAKGAAGLASQSVDDFLIMAGKTKIGQLLHIQKAGTIKEAAGAALNAGVSATSVITTLAIAATIYVCVNNVKSWIGSFLRHINALSVYPVIKNQRPLIAGMAGHKGSVMGYEYTQKDAEDSIQGLIVKSVEWLNADGTKFKKVFPFDFGDILMGMLTRNVDDGNGNKISEYELIRNRWVQTLPLIEDDAEMAELRNESESVQQERLLQMLYGSATTEFRTRNQMIAALRTKWRIPSLMYTKEDPIADVTYKKYHISGVNSIKSLATNDKILALYPIEDEFEIKQAVVKGSHPNVKQLTIVHSQGNAKVQMPFESGNRIIKFFTEASGDTYIYDLPMLQEDAIMILKLILNDQALKNKHVSFLSGTRVNDAKTWKSTGFAFVIDSKDKSALKNALDQVLKDTTNLDKDKTPIFEYQEKDNGFLVIVYAPINSQNN